MLIKRLAYKFISEVFISALINFIALHKRAYTALIKCRIAYKTLIKICWLATSVAKHFISVFISNAYKMLIKRLAYKFISEVFISALINFISVL